MRAPSARSEASTHGSGVAAHPRGATPEQTAHGDLLRRTNANGALELEYDSLGNLLSATASTPKATKAVTYTVDGFGRRVGKQVGGKFARAWLYQDALRPIAEITDTGVFSQFVHAGGSSSPDFMLRSGVAFRFVKDHLGSVRFVVNATTGVVAQALEYDDFGNVTRDTAPSFQPFGFAGGLYDADTGLVRFGARDYDPTVGRWTSKDPIGFEGDSTCLPTANRLPGPHGNGSRSQVWYVSNMRTSGAPSAIMEKTQASATRTRRTVYSIVTLPRVSSARADSDLMGTYRSRLWCRCR